MSNEEKATLNYKGKKYDLPIITGSEGEVGLDISNLRSQSGLITFDPGFGNTGSCKSDITFVDGENGILHYRGYPIEELAEHGNFIETAWLLIFGELPLKEDLARFRALLCAEELIHEDLLHHFNGFPSHKSQPMAILSAVINALGSYHTDLYDIHNKSEFFLAVGKMISKVRTIAAFSYRKSIGRPFMYPDPDLSYCHNFLHMMFSIPNKHYDPPIEAVKALSLVFMLHADHEQNCSTSTVRMVGSTQANIFASVSAGICALWGKLHGGANAAVIDMLEQIKDGDITIDEYLEKVKKKECRLMGFGHRIYKSFDPRARILKKAADNLLQNGFNDQLLDIALELEEKAIADDYFTERKLYPNVDFYSGIILRALGIPVAMFTVMFAIGRLPGWIAHWYEDFENPTTRINRPRQIYTGQTQRNYIPIDFRK
ncbi:citrate synthase [Maridesulfovibrio ferrireducens]|uniref:Citrate synthase n=1 Tax=Maridesulfovibrio ferrireducens TaxID=246191 RepID=A0A1G9G1Y6_9BACT|nr:citrate synthase [Maridesulfovibrio ferrireducens]SDK94313.1 citrate synthase [Maridesulfovibrio ferrireducens]